jgi:hypothetical protein
MTILTPAEEKMATRLADDLSRLAKSPTPDVLRHAEGIVHSLKGHPESLTRIETNLNYELAQRGSEARVGVHDQESDSGKGYAKFTPESLMFYPNAKAPTTWFHLNGKIEKTPYYPEIELPPH